MSNNNVMVIIAAQDDTGAVRDQVLQGLKNMATEAGSTGSAFTKLGGTLNEALGSLGVSLAIGEIVSKLGALVSSSMEAGIEIGHLSQKTGISVQNLSVMGYAADQNGVSVELLAKGYKKLSTTLVQYQAGSKEAEKTFNDLGISQRELADTGGDLWKVGELISDRFAGMPDGFKKNAAATALFGKAGSDLIPLLNQGSASMQGYASQAQALGLVLDEAGVKKMEALHQASLDADGAMKGLGLTLSEVLSLGLQGAAEFAAKLIEKLHALSSNDDNNTAGFRKYVPQDIASVAGDDLDAKRVEAANSRHAAKQQLDDLEASHEKGLISVSQYNAQKLALNKQYWTAEQTMQGAFYLSELDKAGDYHDKLKAEDAKIGFIGRQMGEEGPGSDYASDKAAMESLQSAAAESGRAMRDASEKANAKPQAADLTPTDPNAANKAAKMESAVKERNAAMAKLAEESAQVRYQAEKAGLDKQLAELESSHKRELVSDGDFYAQKLQIQKAALDAETKEQLEKQADIDKNITSLQANAKKHGGALSVDLNAGTVSGGKHPGDAEAVEDQAKIADLLEQRLKISAQIAQISANTAKLEMESATDIYEVKKKQLEMGDELAAKREDSAGIAVVARLKEAADKYAEERKALQSAMDSARASGDPSQILPASDALSNADANFNQGQQAIRTKGVGEQYGLASAQIGAKRTAVSGAADRGEISTSQAQQAKIELDQQEAAELQKLLVAYQQLAAAGDLQATEKVIELGTQIKELQSPVDQAAAHMREQFDGAFQGLFENMQKGKKDWQSFVKDVQKIILSATYKQVLEPTVQAGLGSVFKNGSKGVPFAGSHPTAGIGSALASIPGLSKIPGLAPKGAQGGGGLTVQIINQTSAPASATATSSGGQSPADSDKITEMLTPHVISIVLSDLEHGGSIGQAISGGGLLTT